MLLEEVDASAAVRDWGPLVTTVLLAAITAWYAWLTKRLADSAQESAASARRAAEASHAAVVIAESSVQVEFSTGPVYGAGRSVDPDDEPAIVLAGLTLHANGATVYVHGLTLDRVVIPTGAHSGRWRELGEELSGSLDQFGRDKPEFVLPTRLHRGEMMFFHREDPQAGDPESVSVIEASVMYSLDGAGIGRPLRIGWHGKHGRDVHVVKPSGGK